MTPVPKAQKARVRYTEDEYLAFERAAEERHEYLDGEIYAMASESPEHGTITSNLVGQLYLQLRNKPCQCLTKDIKVRSGRLPKPPRNKKGLYAYPDLLVVCGEQEFLDNHRDVLINPVVVIEVVSPLTERRDRGDKWLWYQTGLPELQDYLLVWQTSPVIEHYNWQHGGNWLYRAVSGLEGEIHLASIDCTLRLSDIYERVNFPPPAEEADEQE